MTDRAVRAEPKLLRNYKYRLLTRLGVCVYVFLIASACIIMISNRELPTSGQTFAWPSCGRSMELNESAAMEVPMPTLAGIPNHFWCNACTINVNWS